MKKLFFTVIILFAICIHSNAQWEWTNGPYGGEVIAMTSCGDKLFVLTYGAGVFLSVDSGETWTKTNHGFPSYFYTTHLAANSTTIYAGGTHGLYRSDDFGNSWQAIFTTSVLSVYVVDSSVFVAKGLDLLMSNDNGANWTTYSHPGVASQYYALLGNDLFVGVAFDGLYKLDLDSGVWNLIFGLGGITTGIFVDEDIIVFFSDIGTSISTDSGITWSIDHSANNLGPFIKYGNDYFGGLRGLFKLDSLSQSWNSFGNIPSTARITAFTSLGTKLFLSKDYLDGIYISEDSGSSWLASNIGLSSITFIQTIITDGATVLTDDCPDFAISYDEGNSWKNLIGDFQCWDRPIVAFKDSFIVAKVDGELSSSYGMGQIWTNINIGLSQVYSVKIDGNTILAGTDQGLFISVDSGTTWLPRNNGITNLFVNFISVLGQDIYIGTSLSFNGPSHSICYSPDYGLSWSTVNSGLPVNSGLLKISTMGPIVFAAIYNEGIYKSEDHGLSWNLISNWPSTGYTSVAVSGSNLFGCSYMRGVYLSRDTGLTWIPIDQGFIRNGPNSIEVSSTHLYAALERASIWKRSLTEIILSANELKEKSTVFLSPNPTQNKLCISLLSKSSQKSKLEIVNLAGSIVHSEITEVSNTSCSKELDLSNFENGFYILRVTSSDGSRVARERFVVQR